MLFNVGYFFVDPKTSFILKLKFNDDTNGGA